MSQSQSERDKACEKATKELKEKQKKDREEFLKGR